MKERPILFSGPMVRAIQANTKTQTRRIVKPQFPDDTVAVRGPMEHPLRGFGAIPSRESCGLDFDSFVRCPYGIPGDRLWVRESWLPARHGSYEPIERGDKWVDLKSKWSCAVVYRADYSYGHDDYDGHWRPSIFMPRWASRLTLEITDVRVERLQDISEADAKAEGVDQRVTPPGMHPHHGSCVTCGQLYRSHVGTVRACFGGNGTSFDSRTYVGGYAFLWGQINGPGSWDANPFVWVVSFRKIAPVGCV